MAAGEQLEWRRGFPSRALRRVAWFTLGAGAVVVAAWVLFGSEPDRLASGAANPLALVPLVTLLAVVLAGGPFVLAVFRRPLVVADHYALTVRPGALRTLLLPWAEVAEVVGATVRGEPLLLVRCGPARSRLGDRPRWYDQSVLRAAGAPVAGFHLAVRMDEFVGAPRGQLAALAAVTPEQVRVTDRL